MDEVARSIRVGLDRLVSHWLNVPLRGKGLVVLAIPLAALVVGAVVVHLQDRQEDEARLQVRRALRVENALEDLLLLTLDAETGVRGYLLSGQAEFLAPHDAAAERLPAVMARLDDLIQDPDQRVRLDDLRPLVERRLDILATIRDFGGTADRVPVAVPTELLIDSNAAMRTVREQIAAMRAAEEDRLATRTAREEREQARSFATFLGVVLLGLIGGLLATLLWVKGVADRILQIETSAGDIARGEPVLNVPRGNDEVGRLGQSLLAASQLLVAREAALQAANRELEAFSYSISHDLRSPLRAVDGFSRILLDDYAAQLPEEAQRYLHLVRDGAQRMGRLIDDLLAFSRLSQQPLAAQPLAPAAIVHRVLDELAAERADRRVEVTVGELPPCEADPALLKQVYTNLLSNALKYTRGREPARIEIGALEPNATGEQTYFVADNGVGFDMAFAAKLFGVFQRLHRTEEFEGTGVGLAIVQRIIHRHGGRIWAEAAIDRGATFFFTLPVAALTNEELATSGAPAPVEAEGVPSHG